MKTSSHHPRLLLALLLILAGLAGTIAPQRAAADDGGPIGTSGLTWSFTEANKTLTISGTGAMPDFVSLDEQPWKELQEKIGKAIIGDNVTAVGESAFTYCSALKNITLPASVKTIGSYAFYYCSKLENITLPASLTTIEENAFAYCKELQTVTIPASVKTIGYAAFKNCSALQSIALPASVKTIGDWVFSDCSALKDLTVAWTNAASIPEINDKDVFYGLTLDKINLHVPAGTKQG